MNPKAFRLIGGLYASTIAVVEQFEILFAGMSGVLAREDIEQEMIRITKKETSESLSLLNKQSDKIFDLLNELRPNEAEYQKLVNDTIGYLKKIFTDHLKYINTANDIL